MYKYEDLKPELFLEENQVKFLRIRDKTHQLLKDQKFVEMGDIIQGINAGTWFSMACVDRLLEIGEIMERGQAEGTVGQHRIFTKV